MTDTGKRIRESSGGISLQVHCALCGTISETLRFPDWEIGEASVIPEGWALLNVTLPQPVLARDMEGLADAVRNITGVSEGPLAAYADGMCRWLEANSPAFNTMLYVCPTCISAKAHPWDEIQKRLVASTERTEEAPPQNVHPFPDRTR